MTRLLRSSAVNTKLSWLPLALCFGFAQHSQALELLTVHELVIHCKHLTAEPDGVDGQYCLRYIQGFIDGAVETDERIVQDMDSADAQKETLTERAMRTRMPRRGMYDRPGSLAGFCLGDPLPLREVVDTVVADLVALDIGDTAESPARIAVDDSLRSHYPCGE
ncbi:hypothetical protein E4634_16325 [Mangrovimicrobium sediminis]|uniref:Rap1a immunity protein domain-containing protein n=1 Tax=Mangrovimicrobium sediminis TaxID=2562682 RepID=A0A4Z0LY63_9GAMM|nr:Rap1a/Tai family immunity protein [Haliea sp. SAOS-164]TGD72229.1 hypothetical protein E4634_16325 [Haliea sp. SAOS-164]